VGCYVFFIRSLYNSPYADATASIYSSEGNSFLSTYRLLQVTSKTQIQNKKQIRMTLKRISKPIPISCHFLNCLFHYVFCSPIKKCTYSSYLQPIIIIAFPFLLFIKYPRSSTYSGQPRYHYFHQVVHLKRCKRGVNLILFYTQMAYFRHSLLWHYILPWRFWPSRSPII